MNEFLIQFTKKKHITGVALPFLHYCGLLNGLNHLEYVS